MTDERTFSDGIYFNVPNEHAPDWIVGSLSIQHGIFLKWLAEQSPNDKGYVKLDIKKSKAGKEYIELNTYVAKTRSPDNDWDKTVKEAEKDESKDLPF